MTDEAATAVNVVGKFVDRLEVSVSGMPRWRVFDQLRAEKGALRTSLHGHREFDSISGVPGGPLMLGTDGGSRYQFVFHNGAISRLEVTSGRSL